MGASDCRIFTLLDQASSRFRSNERNFSNVVGQRIREGQTSAFDKVAYPHSGLPSNNGEKRLCLEEYKAGCCKGQPHCQSTRLCFHQSKWPLAHSRKCPTNVLLLYVQVDLDKAFIIMDDSFSTSAMNEGVRIPFNESRPVACWTEADLDLEVCIAPNLVCSQAKQTAGGGDNISAAALFPQIGRGS